MLCGIFFLSLQHPPRNNSSQSLRRSVQNKFSEWGMHSSARIIYSLRIRDGVELTSFFLCPLENPLQVCIKGAHVVQEWCHTVSAQLVLFQSMLRFHHFASGTEVSWFFLVNQCLMAAFKVFFHDVQTIDFFLKVFDKNHKNNFLKSELIIE